MALENYLIRLSSFDLGQLVDGLRLRAESWRKTCEYMESGYTSDDALVLEECTDSDEAERIAEHYEKIVDSIERQVKEQGGW